MANQKMVVFRGENQDAIINFNKLENTLATNKDGNTSFYQKGNEGVTSYAHFPP